MSFPGSAFFRHAKFVMQFSRFLQLELVQLFTKYNKYICMYRVSESAVNRER